MHTLFILGVGFVLGGFFYMYMYESHIKKQPRHQASPAKLQKIKVYSNHYDYLDYVNMEDLNWLINQIEHLQQENSDLKSMIDESKTYKM